MGAFRVIQAIVGDPQVVEDLVIIDRCIHDALCLFTKSPRPCVVFPTVRVDDQIGPFVDVDQHSARIEIDASRLDPARFDGRPESDRLGRRLLGRGEPRGPF